MQLKRYTTQELQELIPNIFFKYMLDKGTKEVKHTYEEKIAEYKTARDMYMKALKSNNLEAETIRSVEEQLQYLEKGLQYLESSNLKNQKKIYEETNSISRCKNTR